MTKVNKTSRRLEPAHRFKMTQEMVTQWMSLFDTNIRLHESELTELDRAIGDGDHGTNMRRGMTAVIALMKDFNVADLSSQFRAISGALTSSVGGASGPLYGAFYLHASRNAPHKPEANLSEFTLALEAGQHGVMQLGKASVGDKTMVDTLSAAVQSLRASCSRHDSMTDALNACQKAAKDAAEGTIPLVARKGRASYLGERSAGFQDPGAASAALLFQSLAQAVPVFLSSPNPTNDLELLTLP